GATTRDREVLAINCNADAVDGDSTRGDVSATIDTMVYEIRTLQLSVRFCSDNVSDFVTKFNKFNDLITKITKLERDNESLKNEVLSLNTELSNLEQSSRGNNIELQNVPDSQNEHFVDNFS
ncbi:hypothetical protein HHI36_011225, partial [Cryptolaemus montrouzieri]